MEVHETNDAGLVAFVYGGECPHLGGKVCNNAEAAVDLFLETYHKKDGSYDG